VRSNHESDFSGLRRLPLRATNAIKELPLTDWVMEMGAIYFDINPEMGLQAQQDWQTLVYLVCIPPLLSFHSPSLYFHVVVLVGTWVPLCYYYFPREGFVSMLVRPGFHCCCMCLNPFALVVLYRTKVSVEIR
jgi:hypothetical protein